MEPPIKRARQEDNGQNTKEWFDLPEKARKLILEYLDIPSLCRFSRCSKACWEEATSSKNYYLRVRVMENKKNFLISISTEYPYKWTYELDFVAETPTTTNVTYKRQNSPMPLWRKTENGKLVDVVMNYFKSYLQRYHETLKGISMLFDKTTTKSKFVKNIKIRNMPSLENLEVGSCANTQADLLEVGFVDMDQLKTITGNLNLPATKIKLEQLMQFSAREIRVYYTGLSPKPLAQFIDAWAEGKVHENFNKLDVVADGKRKIKIDFDKLEGETETCRKRREVYFYTGGSDKCPRVANLTLNVTVHNGGESVEMEVID